MEIDRLDGRKANQLRPLACSRNILNRAHGSASWTQGKKFSHLSIVCSFELSSHSSSLIAYLSLLFFLFLFLGDTKVLVAVYGPKAGTKKNENPEKACIEVIWKPKSGQIGEFCICLYYPTIIWSMFTYYNIICLLLQWG